MEDKNLTIADIAQELGVSKTTVSRAISGKGRIGEQTRSRELTGMLLDRGIGKMALIGGSENYIVTKNRLRGSKKVEWFSLLLTLLL